MNMNVSFSEDVASSENIISSAAVLTHKWHFSGLSMLVISPAESRLVRQLVVLVGRLAC